MRRPYCRARPPPSSSSSANLLLGQILHEEPTLRRATQSESRGRDAVCTYVYLQFNYHVIEFHLAHHGPQNIDFTWLRIFLEVQKRQTAVTWFLLGKQWPPLAWWAKHNKFSPMYRCFKIGFWPNGGAPKSRVSRGVAPLEIIVPTTLQLGRGDVNIHISVWPLCLNNVGTFVNESVKAMLLL